MDFFLHQERSRTRTLYLIAMFTAAVVMVVVCVYFAVQLGFFVIPEQRLLPHGFDWFDTQRFLMVALITLTVIVLASVIRIVQLSKGGGYVAESLGGELLNKLYAGRKKKRLLNVVEEMAIASGMPVPQVYLLDKEMGINAFAAGYTPSDAAIAVTRGCLEKLNREELQGVIAHEYSHILNGDMRLNIRLIGFLYGIVAIGKIGRDIIDAWSRKKGGKSAAEVVLVAMLLIGIGYIGMLFGQMIQAAVSRQREFLADASAVQFTRNPEGIANALKKIGRFYKSSRIDSSEALEVSHMFFSLAVPSLFLTHPPLDERIRRIEPGFKGRVNEFGRLEPVRGLKAFSEGVFDSTVDRIPVNPQEAKSLAGQLTPEHIDYSSELISALPRKIRVDLDDMLGALGIVCALLLDKDPDERKHQIKALKSIASLKIVDQMLVAEPEIKKLAHVFHFPVLELAIPTLRCMSPDQYDAFKWCIRTLVEADGKLTIFEFVIQKMVTHHLGAYYNRKKRQPLINNINVLGLHTADFLSILAKAGQKEAQDARKAFDAGFARLKSAGVVKKEVYSEKVSLKHADEALDLLARAAPGIKRSIFDACCETVLFDKEVTIREAELLRMAASIMDIPVPPFLSRQITSGHTVPGVHSSGDGR
jgi:Zn-dependent protease with chaperone function